MGTEDFRQLLRDEIGSELRILKELDVEDARYKTTVEGVVKLMDREIELEKLDNQAEEKARTREDELARTEFDKKLRQQQADDAKARDEFERDIRVQMAGFENEMKLKQMEAERKDRLIKIIIDVAGIVIPVMVTIWGTKKSFEFEKEGTITTIMGRGFINKLIPRK